MDKHFSSLTVVHEHKLNHIAQIDFLWARNAVDVFPLMWPALLHSNTGWHRSFPFFLASYQALVLLTGPDWKGEAELFCASVNGSVVVFVCFWLMWGEKWPWEGKIMKARWKKKMLHMPWENCVIKHLRVGGLLQLIGLIGHHKSSLQHHLRDHSIYKFTFISF